MMLTNKNYLVFQNGRIFIFYSIDLNKKFNMAVAFKLQSKTSHHQDSMKSVKM